VKTTGSSTRKKVVVRKLDRGLVKGYLNPSSYMGPEGVEVLDQEGRLQRIPVGELKGIFFVRDFVGNRHRNERKLFQSRPKRTGLWVRLTFTDSEVLEGIIPNNLLDLDPQGFLITPPDVYSNNLRIYIPRSALKAFEVLGVISDGTARRTSQRLNELRRQSTGAAAQIGLFPSPKQSEAE